jgi:hypothetical protein
MINGTQMNAKFGSFNVLRRTFNVKNIMGIGRSAYI